MIKAGIKTTEFWLSVISIAGIIICSIIGLLPSHYAVMVSGIIVGVYTIARAVVKSKSGQEVLDKIKSEIIDKLEQKQ